MVPWRRSTFPVYLTRISSTVDRIRYFVARRSQFLEDGNHSSNLDAYAPQIKAYLLEKYRVIPLGHNFVLLERKANR